MSLLTINYELLLYVYYAGDGSDYSLVYWTSLFCLCARRHFNRGQAVRCVTFDPAHCHGGWGLSLTVSCGSVDSPPCSEHSALRLATGPSRCFSANPWHRILNSNCSALTAVAEMRTSAQTYSDSLACREDAAAPSQRVWTILHSPSPRVSPPLSSIAMEKPCRRMYLTTVQMHRFWKRKWNLDISGINVQVVSLFEYQREHTLPQHHALI